ncbi:MAG: hypothetical protein L0287_37310 [Anaerolineae bacterium]|nr:hypothetical protein [Anaerolineae bacterium]MCI0607842.1 hypothetical protein [Anaerolineae bacterium]
MNATTNPNSLPAIILIAVLMLVVNLMARLRAFYKTNLNRSPEPNAP